MKESEAAVESSISRRSLLVSGLAIALSSLPNKATFAAGKAKRAAEPEVYLLRGLANVFSLGLDEIGSKLRSAGIDAHVEGFGAWRSALDKIVADRQKYGPQPIALVGHSLGANAIIYLAEALEKLGIRVDYMASFAATSPDPLPGNIKRVVNFYFASRSWGSALVGGPGFKGKLENRDFSHDLRVDHFNIEKQRPLQDEVVRDILRLSSTANKTDRLR
jgi:thioesterase domain-containing protein